MSFYLWAMRSAAAILFAVALLILAGALLGNVLVLADSQQSYSPQPNFRIAQLVLAFAMSLQSAALPMFGAALLWRADRWMAGKSGKAG